MKAIWNNTVIAESSEIVTVEGNSYFPIKSVNRKYLKDSNTHSECPWKGTASYYHVEVDGMINKDAAWFYPKPSELAKNIKDHIAFWRGVVVVNE